MATLWLWGMNIVSLRTPSSQNGGRCHRYHRLGDTHLDGIWGVDLCRQRVVQQLPILTQAEDLTEEGDRLLRGGSQQW